MRWDRNIPFQQKQQQQKLRIIFVQEPSHLFVLGRSTNLAEIRFFFLFLPLYGCSFYINFISKVPRYSMSNVQTHVNRNEGSFFPMLRELVRRVIIKLHSESNREKKINRPKCNISSSCYVLCCGVRSPSKRIQLWDHIHVSTHHWHHC